MIQFNPKINRIFVDMDGVLADFDAWVWGQLPKETTTDGQMWKWLQAQDRPYYKFLPMKNVERLWDGIHKYADGAPVKILTGLPFKNHMPEVEQDKIDWFAKYPEIFGLDVDFNVGPYARDKYKHAKPGDILIDDNAKNIRDWIYRAGGIGIYHTSVDATLEQLKYFVEPLKVADQKYQVLVEDKKNRNIPNDPRSDKDVGCKLSCGAHFCEDGCQKLRIAASKIVASTGCLKCGEFLCICHSR